MTIGAVEAAAMILEAFADAFLSIGVFVIVLAAVGARLAHRYGERMAAVMQRASLGPALGALVTLPPGCVGVVAVAGLFAAGRVSYGTLLAAFVATTGDATWILLADSPALFVGIKAFLIALGSGLGYIVDLAGVRPFAFAASAGVARMGQPAGGARRLSVRSTGGESLGREAAAPLRSDNCTCRGDRLRERSLLRDSLWLVAIAALPFSLAITVMNISEEQMVVLVGGVELPTIIGVLGFVLSACIVSRSRRRGASPSCCQSHSVPARWTAAGQGAEVTVWAGVIFVLWEITASTDWYAEVAASPMSPFLLVAIAAGLGLIPACGIEIGVASLFVAGGLPMPALLAYLVSQDGSGFIPLAAKRPRVALRVTVSTTLVALIIGTVAVPMHQ